ncbi:MAG: hypothetical protein IJV64_03575 [Oscillospiraceae bacterium]|nr:hypothetical protein [Oscillospiraceae bacterium]
MPRNVVTKTTINNLTSALKAAFAKKTEIPKKVSDLTNDSKYQTETQVQDAISAALVGALRPSGSLAFADLPAPAVGVVNHLYNVEDAFTTTADFLEGAGVPYPAGTNVAIINVGTEETPSYKYDTYTGTFDFSGFAEKVAGATNGDLAGLDANGNLTDSGVAAANVMQKVASATAGNVASLNAAGEAQDSGIAAADIVVDSDIVDYTAQEIEALLADD